MTKDNFEEFKKADKIVAVAFVASNTDVPAPEFSSTANKHRDDYLFGLSVDKEVAERSVLINNMLEGTYHGVSSDHCLIY